MPPWTGSSPSSDAEPSTWLRRLARITDVQPGSAQKVSPGQPVQGRNRTTLVGALHRSREAERLRRWCGAVVALAAVWPLHALLNGLLAPFCGTSGGAWIVTVQAGWWVVILGIHCWLRWHEECSPVVRRSLDVVAFVGCSVVLSGIALLTSCPFYAVGIVLVVVVRGAFVSERWQEGILPYVGCSVAPLLILGGTYLPRFLPFLVGLDPGRWTEVLACHLLIVATATLFLLGHRTEQHSVPDETALVGPYQLVRRIGGGGMGVVWAAIHPTLKQEVALKLLRPDRQDPRAERRFESEALATARLCHPHIVRVFDFGVTADGLWFYVMELLHGDDLDTLVRRDGPLSEEVVLMVGTQVAEALTTAHAAGIIHRDIKPGNLFWERSHPASTGVRAMQRGGGVLGGTVAKPWVKVLDFGIAKTLRSTVSSSGALDTAVGTPSFAAPEVASGQAATPGSDIYSLGATLYFLMTGAPPFVDPSAEEVRRAHLKQAPVRPVTSNPGPLSTALAEIVLRCLEKDPVQRYADVESLLDELGQLRTLWVDHA